MIDTTSSIMINGGVELLGANDVMRMLGITKMTLYKWVLQKKIKVRRFQIGSRVVLGFQESEVDKIKSRMVKKREPGKSLMRQ